jgi:predicted dinucleotide-binding enzyme
MKVGIIGSGNVGRALGTGFAETGHQVMLGTRDPDKRELKEWMAKTGPKAAVGTFADAASFGEIVIIATRWSGTENAIKLAGLNNFAGKTVVDVTNPLVFHENAPTTLALGGNDSAGEQVQRWLPKSKVVKAFNSVGNAHMFKPTFPGGPPDMFIAGNDPVAKQEVTKILKDFGWGEVINMGGIEGARYLEPLCIIWVAYGNQIGSWNHAFKMLRK